MKLTCKYRTFLPIECAITKECAEEIKQAACKRYGDPWEMTIGEFVAVCGGDLARLGDMRDPTVLQVYWVHAFKDFGATLEKTLKRLQVPMDAQEQQAAESMQKMGMAEGMLVFARNYFGLHSFAEAEGVKMIDYVIAKRDTYNQAIYSKRLADLRAKNYKKR